MLNNHLASGATATDYRTKRYFVYIAITIFGLVMPFVQIDGAHFFLLSFDKKQLHLLFTVFDMQELYLMPFLLIMMFVGIFFITTLGGRVWCGWGCPQTIFRVIYRDLIETKLLKLRKTIENKQLEPDYSKPENKVKKIIGIVVWIALALLASANFMWYFVPPEDFINYILDPMEHKTLYIFWGVIAGFLIYDVVSMKENFCFYVCPYVRIQSVLYDDNTIMAVYDEKRGGAIYNKEGDKVVEKKPENGECIGCDLCVRVCPTHIDIRKGLQLECINCLECVDACGKIMDKFKKPSLVHWTSPDAIEKNSPVKYLRAKTVAYSIVLGIVFVGLLFMSTKKEHMLLNINRTTELYNIKDNRVVENNYIFLFQNTDSKDHEYYFEIIGRDDIKIKRPSKPFKLKAGQKEKVIVILETEKELARDERKDTPLDIHIKAYALDEPERIVVLRNSVFVYPRIDLFK